MAVSRFLAVDLGDSSLKAAEFVSDGKESLRLVNFGQTPLELNTTSEEDRTPAIRAALRKLISEKQFKASRIALTVSGQMALTRFIKLPAAAEEKIQQIARYEAEQNIPFPIEEVVWNHQVIGERGGTELEVVMVAIKKEIIEEFNCCVEEMNLSLEVVDIAPLAIYNTALYNYADEKSDACTLIVDIGARTTNLIFVEGKKIFTRSISIAGNTITQNISQEFEVSLAEAEDLKTSQGFVGLGGAYEEPELESAAKISKIIRNVMTRLHAEISRSINFYKTQQNGKAPKRLLLAGGTSILSYTDHFFREKMEIEVDYFNPFRNIPIDLPVEELEKAAHSMGEVVGLGLRLVTECPIEINLLPQTVIKRRQFIKKIPFFVASLIGVLLVFLSWWLYYWKTANILKNHLIQVTEEVGHLSELDHGVQEASEALRKVRLQSRQIIEIEKARHRWIEFFDDLNKRVPQEIWVVKLTPLNNGQPIAITGAAPAFSGGGRRRGRFRSEPDFLIGPPGLPAPPAAEETPQPGPAKPVGGITEFEVLGLCLHDLDSEEPLKPVLDFRDKLRQSPEFASVEIMEPGNPRDEDWTFLFRVRVTLKTPIVF